MFSREKKKNEKRVRPLSGEYEEPKEELRGRRKMTGHGDYSRDR